MNWKLKLMWVVIVYGYIAIAHAVTVGHKYPKLKLSSPVIASDFLKKHKLPPCSLTIVTNEIKRSKGRPYTYLKQKVYLIPVIIKNNCNDTLKYLSMTCSWPDFYHFNNTYFKVPPIPCEMNGMIYVKIPAHGFKKDYVPVVFYGRHGQHIKHFKIGLAVNPGISSLERFGGYDDHDEIVKRNIIWSGEIEFFAK